MSLTGRQADVVLRDTVTSYDVARLLLRTGIAGAPVRTSAALLHEERSVRGRPGYLLGPPRGRSWT